MKYYYIAHSLYTHPEFGQIKTLNLEKAIDKIKTQLEELKFDYVSVFIFEYKKKNKVLVYTIKKGEH